MTALINKYIQLDIAQAADIDTSFCLTTQSESHLLLVFGLLGNDCLFELADKNYLIRISIAKVYFEKYNELLDRNEILDIKDVKQSICCNIQTKLLDLINCNLTGIYKKIFLESTILFLLYQTQKNSLMFQLNCEACSVLNKPPYAEKMQFAKSYIIDNLSENLTIPKIAVAVGTNQCYLKKGFKEVFNQTIFEFIQENRMIKAKYLLQNSSPTSSPNITEIALSVGYASLSSFSQAYKSYFGVTPLTETKAFFPINK